MKVVHAYSLDCEDIVDVEKAYDLYQGNRIKILGQNMPELDKI